MTSRRHVACLILILIASTALNSCGDDPARPDLGRVSSIPFDNVTAIGHSWPEGELVFVIGRGDSFVTYEEEDGEPEWSGPHPIAELFAGPCPFETIGAMGTRDSWFRGIVNGEGTHFVYPWDTKCTVRALNADFPVGAYGVLGDVLYMYEKGGSRVTRLTSTTSETAVAPRPVEAMGTLRSHVIEVTARGGTFDSFIWNERDVRHAQRTGQPLERLAGLPAVWELTQLHFASGGCDPDGIGEWVFDVTVTLGTEVIARFENVTAAGAIGVNRYPIHVEVPSALAATLTVTLRCSEIDFEGPDARMNGRGGENVHVLDTDGTATSLPDDTGGSARIVIESGVDCTATLSYRLDRVQ